MGVPRRVAEKVGFSNHYKNSFAILKPRKISFFIGFSIFTSNFLNHLSAYFNIFLNWQKESYFSFFILLLYYWSKLHSHEYNPVALYIAPKWLSFKRKRHLWGNIIASPFFSMCSFIGKTIASVCNRSLL